MAAYRGEHEPTALRISRPRRNNYRRLWIAACDDVVSLQQLVRELRHELETVELEKRELLRR